MSELEIEVLKKENELLKKNIDSLSIQVKELQSHLSKYTNSAGHKKYGYIPYVIKDMGKYNKAFVEQEFELFLLMRMKID